MLAAISVQKAHTILNIGDWFLWDWADATKGASQYIWSNPVSMFHRCGAENCSGATAKDGGWGCNRCMKRPPEGLVAAWTFLCWEQQEQG